MQSPLEEWLNRKQPLPRRFYVNNVADTITNDGLTSCWVGIERFKPFHEAGDLKWLSLSDSRKRTEDYLTKASKIISGLDGAWLDLEEVYMIKKELGEPPPLCLPVYLVSIRDAKNVEALVYVGITRTDQRFAGGHAVGTKLTNPEFNQYEKRIYQCSVWLHLKNEYIAMEWLEPAGLAEAFLESVEGQLIYSFQPRFNERKRKTFSAKLPLCIQLQNNIDGKFLQGNWAFPNTTD